MSPGVKKLGMCVVRDVSNFVLVTVSFLSPVEAVSGPFVG